MKKGTNQPRRNGQEKFGKGRCNQRVLVEKAGFLNPGLKKIYEIVMPFVNNPGSRVDMPRESHALFDPPRVLSAGAEIFHCPISVRPLGEAKMELGRKILAVGGKCPFDTASAKY